jgi:hypothetical protein
LVITAPGTPPSNDAKPQCRFRFPWQTKKPARSPSPPSDDSDPDSPTLVARLLEEGITGADYTLPIFDGLSTNPADHLIDLDTDSMERYPDVRVYFWTIGEKVLKYDHWGYPQPPDRERPTYPEARKKYDDKLVKMGRKYLQESRLKKEG